MSDIFFEPFLKSFGMSGRNELQAACCYVTDYKCQSAAFLKPMLRLKPVRK